MECLKMFGIKFDQNRTNNEALDFFEGRGWGGLKEDLHF